MIMASSKNPLWERSGTPSQMGGNGLGSLGSAVSKLRMVPGQAPSEKHIGMYCSISYDPFKGEVGTPKTSKSSMQEKLVGLPVVLMPAMPL